MSGTDSSAIKIEKFIFHVVHHGDDEPILMDETPIEGFENFFIKRITEVLDGNKFFFTPTSSFLEKISSIDKGAKDFLEISKAIAKDFHTHQDKRIKPGVMILIQAMIYNEKKYLLIKYDHENVIYYTYKDNKAILKEITNTFSKSKDALQKSVVMDLNAQDPYAIIIDKSERQNITQFFKNYLGIRRVYDDVALTQKVKDSYLNVVREFKSNLPKEYTSQSQLNFYTTVQSIDAFEPSTFVQSIFGNHYKPEMLQSFERELKRKDIQGEEFTFNKNIPKPKQRKYRTQEGVAIQYPSDADDTVEIKHLKNETIITIKTKQLLEE